MRSMCRTRSPRAAASSCHSATQPAGSRRSKAPSPLLSPPPDLRLRTGDRMTSVKTISEKLAAWRRYRGAVRELSQLTDRELSDIGILRGDIETIVRQSLMKPPD